MHPTKIGRSHHSPLQPCLSSASNGSPSLMKLWMEGNCCSKLEEEGPVGIKIPRKLHSLILVRRIILFKIPRQGSVHRKLRRIRSKRYRRLHLTNSTLVSASEWQPTNSSWWLLQPPCHTIKINIHSLKLAENIIKQGYWSWIRSLQRIYTTRGCWTIKWHSTMVKIHQSAWSLTLKESKLVINLMLWAGKVTMARVNTRSKITMVRIIILLQGKWAKQRIHPLVPSKIKMALKVSKWRLCISDHGKRSCSSKSIFLTIICNKPQSNSIRNHKTALKKKKKFLLMFSIFHR